MKKRIVYTILTLLWMLVIFSMSAQPAEVSGSKSSFITVRIVSLFIDNPTQELIDTVETVIRKLCHFLEYALLSVLIYKTLESYGLKKRGCALCIAVSMLYAISDEIHQYFVPGRACRLYDILIDTLGAVSGCLAIKFFKGKNLQ